MGVDSVENVRFASFISIVGGSGLPRSDWGIVNELQQMLSESSNDSELLTMLTQSIELVGECSLQLLASNVGQLGFGDKGLGLGTDKLLLEDHNTRAVGFFVLELRNLVGDLLFA